MKARFTFNATLCDEIAVDNGVKQGDILALILFSSYFAVLLTHAFQDCGAGVMLRFRTTGKVFDLKIFNAKSKTFETLVRELLYADDANFVAHSDAALQIIMNRFSAACRAFGLTISLKKTQLTFTPPPGLLHSETNILVNDTRLNVVETFPYLGSTVSRDG